MSLVKEPIDQVAGLIRALVPSLTALTGGNRITIWFDAKQAVGPLPLTPSQKADWVNSAIKIMSYRQYVAETPNQVRAVIAAAGGRPL